ncbi:hypothetical protein HN371_24255 [Candidatus Poribacteria bacterium]|jgi:hypothetical protein|nr:hypothetical protein [Candidatus Poribacteria bacterium]MBT5533798.1 hypothetical protein [Candidatus Poribacteria bacterium]MBT5713021.1 hypothetical protein [Candidatus Poribacteria bacterium]MBT7098349.1 hypothetical protein [Candidatus Poribacteria bacterium]MBT7808523.1 hypothetical protein [Candidatus Poribacteria bacterium]
MKMLTDRAMGKARAFMLDAARPLEQARLAFWLDGGGPDAVVHELAQFQNADGGFGHGLEPDLRTPASSALATTVGLQVLREIDAPADHPVVVGAIGYLVNAYDATRKAWEIIPEEADDAPRADWWNHANTDEAFGRFLVNPRAEAVGYLHQYGGSVPTEVFDELTEDMLSHMAGSAPRVEMHDFLCYLRLAETPGLPAVLQEPVVERLRGSVRHTVETDAKAWNGYCTTPLDVAPTPKSLLAGEFTREEIAANLDYLVTSQTRDGSWAPTWQWGRYPTAWRQAKREWKGVLTVRALATLKGYGRAQA